MAISLTLIDILALFGLICLLFISLLPFFDYQDFLDMHIFDKNITYIEILIYISAIAAILT